MRTLLFITVTFLSALSTLAQYGTFSAKAVQAAKATTLLVVLDDGDSPYNRALVDAIKADWKFNAYDFIRVRDLATRPMVPASTYLMKTVRQDGDKHTGTYLSLVMGWKQKKDETLQTTGDAVTNVPVAQDLAWLLIDPAGMAGRNTSGMMKLYVKHLIDYLKQVESGKITDKTTADRLYQGRNRLLRDNSELWVAREHLDKTLPDLAKVKEFYSKGVKVTDPAGLLSAVEKQDRAIAVTDVILTGDHKTKWCYKRVFNAGTGELMYLKDEAALFGKKEGFMDEDLKQIDRAR